MQQIFHTLAVAGKTPEAEIHGILPWVLIGIAAVLLVFIIVIGMFFKLWLQAYMSNANITFFNLIGMRLRKVNARIIVQAKIMAVQGGLDIKLPDLEALYLAGANVPRVVSAVLAAGRENIELDFETAASAALEGRDILKEVRTSIEDMNTPERR